MYCDEQHGYSTEFYFAIIKKQLATDCIRRTEIEEVENELNDLIKVWEKEQLGVDIIHELLS